MSNPPILSLIPRGTPDHPRFILSNQHEQVWTGDGWSQDGGNGLLFATECEAGRVACQILSEATKGTRSFRFIAPVEVEVRADDLPDLLQLKVWLMRAARLFVDYRQPGLPDGTAILSIDWTELKDTEK